MRPARVAVLTVALGVGAGTAAGVELRLPILLGASLALGGGALGMAAVVLPGSARPWVAVIASAIVLGGAGIARGAQAADRPASSLAEGPVHAAATIRDVPSPRGAETVVIAAIDPTGRSPASAGVIALAVPGRSDLAPGDRVELEASGLRPLDRRRGALAAPVLERSGVDAVAVSPRLTLVRRGGPSPERAVASVRAAIAARVDATVPEPHGTLLTAIAFGLHGSMPATLRRPLQDAGLIHLIATSGLKVAIVAGLVGRLLAVFAAGPRARLGISLAAVGGYVAIAGGGAAALRSAATGAVSLGLLGTGRRAAPVALLAVIGAAMLIVDPHLCADVGYQLTFLGTLGILALARPVAERIPGPRLLVEPFAVTLAAQLATIPVSAATFGTVSIVGPFANALVLPVIPLLIVLAWAGVGLAVVAAPLGAPPLLVAQLLVEAIERAGRLCAALPGAAVHLGSWPRAWTWAELAALCAGGVGWLALRRRVAFADLGADLSAGPAGRFGGVRAGSGRIGESRRTNPVGSRAVAAGAGIALLVGTTVAIGLRARADGGLRATVLDVGAASATVLRVPDGELALVGAGSDPVRLVDALGAELPPGAHGIDLLVLAGGERAASGGLSGLPGHVDVRRAVVPDGPLGGTARQALLGLRRGGTDLTSIPIGGAWSWGGAAWRFLDLGAPLDADAGVAPLAAVEVTSGDGAALLLGDAGIGAQEQLAAAAGRVDLHAPVLVAPPEGILAPSLVGDVKPRTIAIPCGRPPRSSPVGVPSAAIHLTCTEGPVTLSVGADGGEAG